MKNYTLTTEDLLYCLKEQLYFLDSSLSNYSRHDTIKKFENKVIGEICASDVKTEIEAKRIATIVRILLHDTKNCTSLLTHLQIKDKIYYIDTSAQHDGRLHSMTGIHGGQNSNSNQYLGLVAKINTGDSLIATPVYKQHLPVWYHSYSKLDFDKWWKEVIIISKGFKQTRKDLILNVVNKDGGAHIDTSVPDEYYEIKKSRLYLNIRGIETEFERNVVYASIAQIGWELLNSIDNDTIENCRKSGTLGNKA